MSGLAALAACSSGPGTAADDRGSLTAESRPDDRLPAAAAAAAETAETATADDTPRSDRRRVDPVVPLDTGEPLAVQDSPLLRVGDRTIDRAALADVFLYFFRDSYYEAVGYLIEQEIVRAEAARLDVNLTRAELEETVDAELELQAREIATQFGGEVTLEEFVEDNFKLGMGAYRQRVGQVVRAKLLRDRVIRYSLLREGWVDVRRIAVPERAEAEDIKRKLDAGADFDTMASRYSAAASRGRAGLLEGVRRGFLPPDVDRAVTALAEHEITDVLEVVEVEGTHYDLYRLIRRVPGERVSYGAVRERIASELERNPVSSLEVLQWNRAVGRRYPVEYVSP